MLKKRLAIRVSRPLGIFVWCAETQVPKALRVRCTRLLSRSPEPRRLNTLSARNKSRHSWDLALATVDSTTPERANAVHSWKPILANLELGSFFNNPETPITK
jgi:hypothetical protein